MNLLPRPRRLELSHRLSGAADPAGHGIDPTLPAQGYRLRIDDNAVDVAAADDAGAFYARATLAQLRGQHGGDLPVGAVHDWPDVAVRAVLLDVSRDKVPTMATLLALVDRLASLKINQIQLYMEHTYAYAGHEEVWRDASPFTAAEIVELQDFCAARFVELVPNQNVLGHMERWLRHDRYRRLAIEPDGWTDGRGRHRPPTTVDPSHPGSIALARELLGELVPQFRSRRVNVGLDEPWELSDDRFGEYVDYIAAVRAAPELDDREVLMWGDIVAKHPDALAGLPDGVTVCEWGYEADHPFDERAAFLRAAGREFWLCPGTSSWNTIIGRVTNARHNCASAARAAVTYGAAGYLVTDWGDNGHLQYLPFSAPGLAEAAALSWCSEANADLDLAAALDAFVFADAGEVVGAALVALGDAYLGVVPRIPNNSALAIHLYYPQLTAGERVTEGLAVEDLEAVRITLGDASASLAAARMARPDGALVVDELRAGAALVDLLCRDAIARLRGDGSLASVPGRVRAAHARELDGLADEHRRLWLARNRSGGLGDSASRLERCRDAWLADA